MVFYSGLLWIFSFLDFLLSLCLQQRDFCLNGAIFKPGLLSASIQQVPVYWSGRGDTRFSKNISCSLWHQKIISRLCLEVKYWFQGCPIWIWLFSDLPCNFGIWLLACGSWCLALGVWLLVSGSWRLALGVWPLVSGSWLLLLASGSWCLALGVWLLTIGGFSSEYLCHSCSSPFWFGRNWFLAFSI